jgi:hypothetical protein
MIQHISDVWGTTQSLESRFSEARWMTHRAILASL